MSKQTCPECKTPMLYRPFLGYTCPTVELHSFVTDSGTGELEDILRNLEIHYGWVSKTPKNIGRGVTHPVNGDLDRATTAIQALIDRREAAARVDELEQVIIAHYAIEGAKRDRTFAEHLSARLASLREGGANGK